MERKALQRIVLHSDAPRKLDQDALVSQEQVAAYLHVSLATLRRWVYLGKLPAIKIGRRVVLRVDDIERFLQPRGGTGAREAADRQ